MPKDTYLQAMATSDMIQDFMELQTYALMFIEKEKLWGKFEKYLDRKMKD